MRPAPSDHTFVQALVYDGQITPEQGTVHPHRSVLAKVLDGRDDIEPDFSTLPVQPSDRFLLCSDGLSAVVHPEAIEQAMASSDTPEATVGELISLALRAGGPDNITCIVAYATDPQTSAVQSPANRVRLGTTARAQPRTEDLSDGFRTGGRSASEQVAQA